MLRPPRSTVRRAASAALAVVALLPGCAFLSRQPNSPARDVTFRELEPAPTAEKHYLVVFGSQSFPKVARLTHSWITMVRITPEGQVEQHSISWMPRTLNIRTFSPVIEPGVNLSLRESLKMAKDSGQDVSMWGPFEIPPGLHKKLMIQKDFIESGAIGYQCIDTIGEAAVFGDGSNCIHAISDADTLFRRQAYPLTYFGDAASLNILRQMAERGAIPDPKTTHDWLLPHLGLDDPEINRREYTRPLLRLPYRLGVPPPPV